jgi:Na+/H+ antiporter NhaD/arsenite permease-like protein
MSLGFLSAAFDNIPLTALALKQGGYDWSFLAYAVGFGGSMLWFGSSAGIALCNMYREARSVVQWLRHAGWIVIAYVISFLAMLSVSRWQPDAVSSQPATQPLAIQSGDSITAALMNISL